MAKKEQKIVGSPTLAKVISEEKEDAISFKIKQFLSGKAGIEQYIVVGIWSLAILFVLYMLYLSINVPTSYTLNADSPTIFDKTSELYIDNEKALGPVELMNGSNVRRMTPRSFNLVFNPKNKEAWKDKNLTLELELMGSGSELYINNELVLPNFEDYDLVKDFSDSQVWVTKELRTFYNKNNLQDKQTPEEYYVANFEGTSLYSLKDLNYSLLQPVVTDYKQEWTDINTTFRDNLKLAVYVENSLDLKFTKQDLQMYLGPDEYTLTITSLAGETIFSSILPDDGEAKDTKILGPEQPYEITLNDKNGITKGIYYITFTKDEYNIAPDSTLKKISANTNKIMIIGDFLPVEPFVFYTKVAYPKIIGFYVWLNDKTQNVEFFNIKQNSSEFIKLDINWIGKRYDLALNKVGAYLFNLNPGAVWIYGESFSPYEESIFPITPVTVNNAPFVLIIDKSRCVITENRIMVTFSGNNNKFKVRTLLDSKLLLNSISLFGK